MTLFFTTIIAFLLLRGMPLLEAAEPKPGWEVEWKRTLEGAKKENTVVVAGSPDPVMRKEIIPRFTARFGISVQYIAGGANQIVARLSTERNTRLYSTDIFMVGMNTAANVLYPNKMLDPLRPLLILPDVVDPSKWRKGKLWFQDPEERYVLRAFSSIASLFFINGDHVRAEGSRESQMARKNRRRGSAPRRRWSQQGCQVLWRVWRGLRQKIVQRSETGVISRAQTDSGLARARHLPDLP
jgi:hypothetical protein